MCGQVAWPGERKEVRYRGGLPFQVVGPVTGETHIFSDTTPSRLVPVIELAAVVAAGRGELVEN